MILSTMQAGQGVSGSPAAQVVVERKVRKPAARQRTCIIVLGMHRSGTSAFARVASLLGCALPSDLMAPSEGNMIGHWESNVITTLNDELLASAGSRWDDWLSLSKDWTGSVLREEFVDRAVHALREEYGQSSLFVLKDPRICRVAPLWLEALTALGVRSVVAMPVRNPVEVAESLAARDGSAPGHGLLVWLRNVLDAEAASRDLPRHIFGYESLLRDWSTVIEAMEGATGIVWPRKSVLTASEIDVFLVPDARHQQYDGRVALGSRTPAWVRDTYAILTKWCDQGEDREDYARLDKIRADFDASAPTFAQLITQGTVRGDGVGEAGRKRRQLEEEVVQLAEQLLQVERRNEAVSQDLAAAEEAVKSARNDCAELERVLTETTADRDVAMSGQRAAVEEQEKLAAGFAKMHGESDLLRARDQEQFDAHLALVRSEVDSLRDQLAKASQADITREENFTRLSERSDGTISDLKNRLSEAESALLQRQEEARQAWADVTVERRANDMLRSELDRAHARYDALELRFDGMDNRLHEQAQSVLAAEVRALENGWAAKEAALREAHAQDLIVRQAAELDKLMLDRQDHASRLARYEGEVAQLIKLQLQLEISLRSADGRAETAERLAAALPLPSAPSQPPSAFLAIDPSAETASSAALAQVGRQSQEIAQLTRMAADEAERVNHLQRSAEWLRDFSDLQQRVPRWWAVLPAAERARRLHAKLEALGMFNVPAYLSKYPDVAQSGMDPLVHYARHGIFEGRSW